MMVTERLFINILTRLYVKYIMSDMTWQRLNNFVYFLLTGSHVLARFVIIVYFAGFQTPVKTINGMSQLRPQLLSAT